jgi:hypothetical protein
MWQQLLQRAWVRLVEHMSTDLLLLITLAADGDRPGDGLQCDSYSAATACWRSR